VRVSALFGLQLMLAARLAQAQGGCADAQGTSFAFGKTGGTLVPDTMYVAADGTVRGSPRVPADANRVVRVPRDSMLALAHTAWERAFIALPAAPVRPTRNPDAARSFINVSSACGRHKRVEAVPEEAPLVFRELLSRLRRLTGATDQP
jgi:hypothetical protein